MKIRRSSARLAFSTTKTGVEAARPAAEAFSPASAAAPRALAPGRRYVNFLMVVEGFGAWSDSIYETLNLAVRLNRSWVEPCVRNGCIEPCRCGRIRPVAAWSPAAGGAAAGAGVDPGVLPRIADGCKLDLPPRDTPLDYIAEAYPLSAYVDVAAIAAEYAPGTVVSYAEWCGAWRTAWVESISSIYWAASPSRPSCSAPST